MNIILTDDVAGLGDIGETVKVKAGYARNYLIPRGLARETGSGGAKQLAHWMKQIEAKKKKLKVSALERAESLNSIKITLELRVGEHNRVFGSISAKEIAQKLVELGLDVDRRRVLLLEPIRKIGEHKVAIKLHQDVEGIISVLVNAKKATKEDEANAVYEARNSIEDASAAEDSLTEEEDTEE